MVGGLIGTTKKEMSERKVAILPQGNLKFALCCRVVSGVVKNPTRSSLDRDRQRIELFRALLLGPGFIESSHRGEKQSIPFMCRRVAGIDRDGASEFPFGFWEIPVVIHLHQSKCRM